MLTPVVSYSRVIHILPHMWERRFQQRKISGSWSQARSTEYSGRRGNGQGITGICNVCFASLSVRVRYLTYKTGVEKAKWALITHANCQQSRRHMVSIKQGWLCYFFFNKHWICFWKTQDIYTSKSGESEPQNIHDSFGEMRHLSSGACVTFSQSEIQGHRSSQVNIPSSLQSDHTAAPDGDTGGQWFHRWSLIIVIPSQTVAMSLFCLYWGRSNYFSP